MLDKWFSSSAKCRINNMKISETIIAATLIAIHCDTSLAQRETVNDRPVFSAQRKQVLALSELTEPPQLHPADGFVEEGGIKPIFFEGLPWRGKPTRVFAWLGLPKQTQSPPATAKAPGIVLVHGGGGTAFKPWVSLWNEKGFAAISIAVEGQTDKRGGNGKGWNRHDWAGPARSGIYGDSAEPLADQWMYHAVADTVLANSLLRSLPQVDAAKVGVMGISWGGVITSTVIGIDDRFAFGIPTYGCGDLSKAENQYGRALGNNPTYLQVWDPILRIKRAALPVLWLSWTGDQHFPLDSLRNCYVAAPGPHMVAMVPNMRHSHAAGWNPPDSYAFAESIVQTGAPWCRQVAIHPAKLTPQLQFASTKPIDKAQLVWTADEGFTGNRRWIEAPATLEQYQESVHVDVEIPPTATAWFVNVFSDKLVASSDLYGK